MLEASADVNLQQLVHQIVLSDTAPLAGVQNRLRHNEPDVPETFDQISHVLKTILKTGRQHAFLDQLSNFVHKKELDIEKMCNHHYQEFVQAVDQLLRVRVGAVDLKSKILDLNTELQNAGHKMLDKKKELMEHRRILQNIETATETTQNCLFVLDIVNQITKDIEKRKYYSALRMLEDLQNLHLRSLMQYTFAQMLNDSIPGIRNIVQDSVTDEMQDWLVRIRENSRNLGHAAITEHIQRKEQLSDLKKSRENETGFGGLIGELNQLNQLVLDGNNEQDESEFSVDNKNLDFRPLHQCVHIHAVLGKKLEFKASFEQIREVHAKLLMDNVQFPSLQDPEVEDGVLTEERIDAFVSSIESYCEDVAGFFVVENVILEWTKEFRNREAVEHLWREMIGKMFEGIASAVTETEDPELFIKLKGSLVNFLETMEGIGFVSQHLIDLLFTNLQTIVHFIQQQLAERIITILEEDEYTPMTVNDQKELDGVIDILGSVMKHVEGGKLIRNFPQTLPFTKGFVSIVDLIKKFIRMFYKFSEGFKTQSQELDDVLRKALEMVLGTNLNEVYVEKLSQTNLSQSVQIILNLEFLELSCEELIELINEIQTKDGRRVQRVSLGAATLFQQSRRFGEMRIFETVNLKVDEFLSLADHDWATPEIHGKPSAYLQDMVDFVTNIVTITLSNLPLHIRQYIYKESFTHLGHQLLEILVNSAVKRITIQSLENFNLDLLFLENFVEQLKESDVGDGLVGVRELVDLMRDDNPEKYLDADFRSKKYSRVRPEAVGKLCDKLRGEISLFAKASDKKRQSSLTNLSKGVRQILKGTAASMPSIVAAFSR